MGLILRVMIIYFYKVVYLWNKKKSKAILINPLIWD